MIIIGLVGGVASGKSAVAAALARRGAVVFDADQLAHRVLDEPEVRDALVARWGPEVLDPHGRISRPAVAQRVFGVGVAPAEREFLEETVHPRIRQRIEAAIRQLPDAGTPAVVLDAPLLFEAGWAAICQAVLLVDAPLELRTARAAARGWSPEELARREATQLPIEEKRRRSTHVIDNSGNLDDLDARVGRFWSQVCPD